MGYRIEYHKIGTGSRKKSKNWKNLIVVACVLCLVAGAVAVKTVGLTWVQEVLLPGDPKVTAAALEGLLEDLRQGDSLGQAIKTFCEEIVANGAAPE